MNADRVDIFHTADGNCVVVRVTHNLKLDFLITINTLFNKYLMHRRKFKGIKTNLNKLVLIVSKTAAGTAQSKGRTQNYGITDSCCSLFGFLDAVCDFRGNNRLTNRLAKFFKQLAVLGTFNTFTVST